MNVCILYGGRSFEHEVSIITGLLTTKTLATKYNVLPVYISKDQKMYLTKDLDIEDFRNDKYKKCKIITFCKNHLKTKHSTVRVDVAIICTHGLNGEDGLVKGLLDFNDIPSVGSNMISSGVSLDKYFTYCVLKDNKIKVLKTKCVTTPELPFKMKYPVILKPAKLGSSIGISVVNNKIEYKEKIKHCLAYDEKVCIQPYLKNIVEYNISLYKKYDQIITSKIEVINSYNEIFSYDEKYEGRKLVKHEFLDKDDPLYNQIVNTAKQSYKVLQLDGIVRIDFIYHNDTLYINEVNTIPGSLSYYLYDDKFIDILDSLIRESLFNNMNKHSYNFKTNILFNDYQMKK